MTDSVIIKSSRSAGELKLSEPKPPGLRYPVQSLRVSLKDRDIAASSSVVYLHEGADLAWFFVDLAVHWKGWQGEKQWRSVEGDFALSCTVDALGHAAMQVTLKSGPYENDWCVQVVIYVEANQLEQVAAKVREFLHLPSID